MGRLNGAYKVGSLFLKDPFFPDYLVEPWYIYNLGNKTDLYQYVIVLTVLLECKTEKQNSQREQRQFMEQTRSLFCMCDIGVAHYQSQHQCHF